jgi:glucose-1-phosphate thymidylyltransferase
MDTECTPSEDDQSSAASAPSRTADIERSLIALAGEDLLLYTCSLLIAVTDANPAVLGSFLYKEVNVKGLIMAAGYATRLWPLTLDRAKPLLPIAGRPIIDYIVDEIEPVEEVDRLYVVTNSRFAPQFRDWAAARETGKPVEVIDDGTVSDDDKLGAIGDIRFVIDQKDVHDDLFVIAGDNLFDLNLRKFVAFFKKKGTAVAAYNVADREAAKRYGIVAVDKNQRVIDFQEKPSDPPSTLAAIGMYLFPKDRLKLFEVYAGEGNNQDAPGHYVSWVYKREPVYAYVFDGVWYDIGDLEMYRRAEELYRKGSSNSH